MENTVELSSNEWDDCGAAKLDTVKEKGEVPLIPKYPELVA